MKRIALFALAVMTLVLVVVAVAIPRVLSASFIKERVAQNLSALTGRDVTLKGAPVLSIYPVIAVSIGDLTIANPAGMAGEPLLTADSVTAEVRLLPLLLGSPEFDSIELTKPRIHLVRNADGQTNWELAAPAGTKRLTAPPRDFKITAGSVVIDDAAASRHEEIAEFDLDASWPGPGSTLGAMGTARWRGEPVDFNGQIDDPLAVLAGTPTAVRAAFAAQPMRVAFTGTLGPGVSGDVTVTTPALRRAVQWMGIPIGNGPTLSAASIKGKMDWSGTDISFANATVELDGNSAMGAFSVDYGGPRPMIQGSLAATSLDLSPYLDAIENGASASALLSPATLPAVAAVDADIGLSASHLTIGTFHLDAAAGSIATKGGKLTVSLGQAQLYGGSLTADATLSQVSDTISAKAEAKATGVGAGAALSDLVGAPVVAGTGMAEVTIAGQGATWAELLQGISGRATFTVSDGALNGVDLAGLSALADGPAEPLLPGSGSLKFANLTGTATLSDGTLRTTDVALRGDTYRIVLGGWGSLLSGLVDAEATLFPADAAKVVPLAISGSWRDPVIELDRERIVPPSAAVTPGR